VYYGGALFYHALRERIGDEAFFESLREYYQRFHYRIATTKELLRLFEEVSGEELDDLYEEWLFAEGIIILLDNKNLLSEEA
jgi:aminopeptidase N